MELHIQEIMKAANDAATEGHDRAAERLHATALEEAVLCFGPGSLQVGMICLDIVGFYLSRGRIDQASHWHARAYRLFGNLSEKGASRTSSQ